MHARNEGLAKGLSDTVMNKGSGVAGPLMDFLLGVDNFGKEISDPNAPGYQQLAQRVSHTMGEFEPITLQAIRDPKNADRPLWQPLLGFAPAPKYTQETPAEGHIRMAYQDYVRAQKEPFDRVMEGADHDRLRMLYSKQDPDFFPVMQETVQKYGLQGKDQQRLMKSLEDTKSVYLHMFQRVGEVSWKEQNALFQRMSVEEKQKYLPLIVKEHRGEAARELVEEMTK
jgi:hypothetical protein